MTQILSRDSAISKHDWWKTILASQSNNTNVAPSCYHAKPCTYHDYCLIKKLLCSN